MRTLLLALTLLAIHPSAFAQTTSECKVDADCKSRGENFACMTQKTGCPGHESESTCVIRVCREPVKKSRT